MRVLITVPPVPAHLHQLVPLAWALRTAGHEVRVAGGPGFTGTINRTGLVAVGDLVEHVALWRPDLVVWDGAEPPPPAVDALSVRVLGMMSPDARGGAGSAGLTLDFLPPSLRDLEDDGHRLVRFVPYTGPSVIPAWLRRPPRRRRVLLTAGEAGMAAALAGIAGVDAEVVCAAAQVPPGADLPRNVRVVDDLPLVAVLPSCSAVLHDGAAVPVAAAVAAGQPQLGLVTGPAPWLFERVAGQGAGVLLDPGTAAVGEHLTRLLTDPVPLRRAKRLRDELAAMPSPHDVVPELEFAASHA